jgi:hypothetical protein
MTMEGNQENPDVAIGLRDAPFPTLALGDREFDSVVEPLSVSCWKREVVDRAGVLAAGYLLLTCDFCPFL